MRKLTLGALVAAAISFGATAPAWAFEPTNPECVAPATPGGGWDFTCRQGGKVMHDLKLVPSPVQVTNLAGGGGGVAFAQVVSKRNEDNNLIVAASTATTTRLAQGQFAGMTADQVRWLGTLGADYGVIAVGKDSKFNTLAELLDAVKADPKSVSFAGGSAIGGWDHLKVLIAAKAAGVTDVRTVKYVAFGSGGDAVTQLVGGHVTAFTGDISETLGFMKSGDLKVLGVLSPERLPGDDFKDIPTAKEQGIDAVGANWRGFYAPGKMSDEAYTYWSGAIAKLYGSDEWKATMTANGLMPFGLTGPELTDFVTKQVADIQSMSKDLGLIK